MMHKETPDRDKLFEEALDLIVRVQNNPANPVTCNLVQSWRARGSEHEAAWAEVSEIYGLAGKVLQDKQNAGRVKNGISRRNTILGGVAGIVAVGASALYGPELVMRAKAHYSTAKAELRQIALADGSAVTLGPDSAIQVDFQPALRRVVLLAGMAFFEVVEDATRAFQVIADDLTVTAVGTEFDLSRDAGLLTVSVDEGVVEVAMPGSPRAMSGRLSQGEWLIFDESARTAERGHRGEGLIAAWRDGMILAERESVAAVVARIARWKQGRVVIADPYFGAHRISGVFDLNDPVAALEAVVHPHGGKVRQFSPWLTVISPI